MYTYDRNSARRRSQRLRKPEALLASKQPLDHKCHYGSAEQHYRRAIAIDPEHAGGLRGLPLAILLIRGSPAGHDRQVARGCSKMDRLVGYTFDARPFVAN